MNAPYPRGTCPDCGKNTTVRKNGTMSMHLPPEVLKAPVAGKRSRCPGSGKLRKEGRL